MSHKECCEFDQKLCKVIFEDGTYQTGLVYVFDLIGEYKDVYLYLSGPDSGDCVSFYPKDVREMIAE